MCRTLPVALSVLLAMTVSGASFATEPDDRPWDVGKSANGQPLTIEDVLTRDIANRIEESDVNPPGADQPDLFTEGPEGAIRRDDLAKDRLDATRPQAAPPKSTAPGATAIRDQAPGDTERRFEPAQSVPVPSDAVKAPGANTPGPQPQPASTPPAAAPAPAAPQTAAAAQVPGKFYLPLRRYFETTAAVTLKDFDQADREALARFYDQRFGEPLFVSKDGLNAAANGVIETFNKSDGWGLSNDDFKFPVLNKSPSGDYDEEALADAELKLALAAMQYAREARGDRIDEPSTQLSSYLDRKPQLVERSKLLAALNAAPDKGAYLLSLHPKHPQFERLRQKLVALRTAANKVEFEKIPDGPKIVPGKAHWQVALVRRRLGLPEPGIKPDGTADDDTFYDDALAKAVVEFKQKNDIEPVNPTITTALRKALNKDERVDERMILANMEQWRWMPDDLGSTYINVNIPEFAVRVVKNGAVIHSERVVTGKFDTQTPIFSDMMRTVVFQPSWNVPESIKILELLPALRSGRNPIEGRGLVMQRNGHDVNVWDIDWETQDIRNFHIYQPPGDANVLGIVKFLFPNKHSVYLHDTPSKNLFNEKVRMFSHGCMRLRNPVQLAEVIMAEDMGWAKEKVNEMITNGPEDHDVALEKPIPVHVTYFTAWVEDNGELKTFADIYGHEQRIKLGLEGRWSEIVKNRDHLLPPEDAPIARSRDDWGDDEGSAPPPQRQSRPARYTYRQEAPAYRAPPQAYRNQPVYKKKSGFQTFMNNLFGN